MRLPSRVARPDRRQERWTRHPSHRRRTLRASIWTICIAAHVLRIVDSRNSVPHCEPRARLLVARLGFSSLYTSTIATPCARPTVSGVIAIRAHLGSEGAEWKFSRQFQRGLKGAPGTLGRVVEVSLVESEKIGHSREAVPSQKQSRTSIICAASSVDRF
jgi:hypothetical protein